VLPVELKDITPGSHKLRFEAGDRYDKLEQSVDVEKDKLKEIGPIKLKVLRGQISLELVTAEATVKLVNAKKTEKKIPEKEWKKQPLKLDLDPSEGWKLVASKKGMDDFTQELAFDDGNAEKSIKIDLAAPKASAGTTDGSASGSISGSTDTKGGDSGSTGNTSSSSGTTTATDTKAGGDKTPPPAGGNGTLNINSIPVSKVVLDGRPLGSTPKVGVSVPAGSHTVVFIHPEKGKQSVSVTVKAGETKTAAVKFK